MNADDVVGVVVTDKLGEVVAGTRLFVWTNANTTQPKGKLLAYPQQNCRNSSKLLATVMSRDLNMANGIAWHETILLTLRRLLVRREGEFVLGVLKEIQPLRNISLSS
jgi:hypothetical protein